MATINDIYQVLKKLIPENFTTSVVPRTQATIGSDYRATVEPLENHCTFEIGGAENPEILASGEVVANFDLVTLNLFIGRNDDDFKRGAEIAETIQNKLDQIFNKEYNLENGDMLWIMRAQRLRGIRYFYNEHGTVIFAINYIIKYI